jgi:6-phosphogluconolactonase
MSTRFTWVLGFLILLSIGLLVACGSNYSASSDGLVVVPSQGMAVVQSFSFNLSNGHVATIDSNPAIPGPPDQGFPASIVLDPTGSFAFVTSVSSPCSSNGSSVIATYKVNSDGSLSALGTQTLSSVIPVALAIDSGGKYLFAADTSTCLQNSQQNPAPGVISVFSIGSNASLTEVPGSPFAVPTSSGGGNPNPVALAVTPTTFPAANAPCSNNAAPANEYLYVADAQNNGLWGFSVDTSSGALTVIQTTSTLTPFPTGSIPSGVAVDPCNRFVYIANQQSNNISAYTICNKVLLPSCPNADGSLIPVTGSPFGTSNGPGPLVVSAFGNFLYVLDKSATAVAGEISAFQISQSNGSLSPLSPATVTTGNAPVSIAVRADGDWLFVTNNGSASGNGSISQYAITPATGTLSPSGTGILTDTYPWGIAVK